MAKRDKKKIIRVALVGDGKVLRGLGPDMAAINLALYGVADPEFGRVSKEDWEAAYPEFDSKRFKSIGVPMIFGTGSEASRHIHERYIENSIPENLKQYPFVPVFGVDPYEFNKEAEGSWYDQAEKSVNEKQVGWVQRYHDWLEKNPPMDYDEPITKERLKEIINKLSKR